MSNVFGDGDDFQGSFVSDNNKGKGADDEVLDDKTWAKIVYEAVLKKSESDEDELKSTISSIKDEFDDAWGNELMKKCGITSLY